MAKNGNIESKLGKRQRRGILHGASESRKLLGDAKQQTNPVELTSEPLLPNLESKRVGADGNPPLEGQDMQMIHPYPQSVQRKSL